MKDFEMCGKCKAEYDDPHGRRFHAQPNACADCGPHISLKDNTGKNINSTNPVEKTAILLKQGHIIAIKGLGGFHLAADAANNDIVARLRRKKIARKNLLRLCLTDLSRSENMHLSNLKKKNCLSQSGDQ